MSGNDREERWRKIASVFAFAANKARFELRREVERSGVQTDTDSAVITAWVRGQGRLRIRFSIGEDNSIRLSETERTGEIGNLYDNGIEGAVAKAIVNEVRKRSG
jgi:hypothetical protein